MISKPSAAARRLRAAICFIALILYRVMRSRLRAADTGLSPERALQQLQRIQHHRVRLNGAEPIAGVSLINQQQSVSDRPNGST